jgi:hypothetical protein
MSMDFESWRCCHSEEAGNPVLFCPPEGCPVSYGCARDKGWKPGDPTPAGCISMPEPAAGKLTRDEAMALLDKIEPHVAAIRKLFPGSICLTLLVRSETLPKGSLLITNDVYDEIAVEVDKHMMSEPARIGPL